MRISFTRILEPEIEDSQPARPLKTVATPSNDSAGMPASWHTIKPIH
jgi:hypothetical protein